MQFKVLTHCDRFIDESMLYKGLYSTDEPKLYNLETTLDDLIDIRKKVGSIFNDNRYDLSIDNLSKCTLTIVEVKRIEQPLSFPQPSIN
ncbi:hypothetical protein [Joostella sp.]|uniref:hypothetical protein n=1 Tax=Joostella sp. TaxID=2231138 RepID=UPI003A9526C7